MLNIVRRKILTALSLVAAFTLVFSAQVSYANFNIFHHSPKPTMTPTTSPVTGPVTGPITSPAKLFTISGNVSYHVWGLFKRGASRLMPASGVTVKAKGLFNGSSATATTDSNGNYVITTNDKGHYRVTVSGGNGKHYMPPLHFVQLTEKKPTKTKVNFTGHTFKF